MNNQATKTLLDPIRMGSLGLKNRVVLAPMTRGRAGADRVPTPTVAEYYRQRSGAGLLITEAAAVSKEGNAWVAAPAIYTDEHVAGWKTVVDSVHAEGSKIFLQLWFGGRAAHSSMLDGELPVAPSAIRMNGEGVHTENGKQPHETPRALATDEIAGVVESYVAAARRAKDAGFDGVEIHAANGYLIDQFLQSKTNKRTDRYGGDLENRFRFLKEIVEGIQGVYPSDRIGVRLSPNGVYNDMGSEDFRETVMHAATELDKVGLAYLHIVDGLAFGFHELGQAVTLDEISAVFHGTLMGNCGYELETANTAIANGSADLIAFGRPYIANPDLVERFRNQWPLAESEPDSWFGGDAVGTGYTDFPAFQPATAV
jgi:N-ethylmaleimide reductase